LRLAPCSATMWMAETVRLGVSLLGENWFDGALVRAGVRLGGQARVGCRSSLRRGRGGMMGCAVQLAGGVNQSGATTPRRGS
jgi:hypothetical protein